MSAERGAKRIAGRGMQRISSETQKNTKLSVRKWREKNTKINIRRVESQDALWKGDVGIFR
jgi:hypothetical protein